MIGILNRLSEEFNEMEQILYITVSAPRKVIFVSYNVEYRSKEIFYTYVIDGENPFIGYNPDKAILGNYLGDNLIGKK